MSALTQAAAVVLRDEGGRVLLVKENYGRGRWGLPGGAIEPGETPATAAVREAAEEVGVTVGLDHLIGLYELHGARPGLRFIFAGRIIAGEPALPDTGELAAFDWFGPDELPANMTHSGPVGIGDAVAAQAGVLRDLRI